MIAWLCCALAFAGVEVGGSVGVALAEQTAHKRLESAATLGVYAGLGVLGWLRGEAHLAYTGLGGAEGVDAVEVVSRSGDARALVGVAFPFVDLPKVDFGADLLFGPDFRLTSVRTEVLGVRSRSLATSVHPSMALGPFAEVGLARLGVRAWADLPREGRLGFSIQGGLRF